MKKIILLLMVVISILPQVIGQVSLMITIPNVSNDQGLIQIGLFNEKEHFPKEGKEFLIVIRKAESPVFVHTIEGLQPGDYAIALMHDENADGVCNLNFFGIPKEGYGFSNNVKPRLSSPSFESARISLTVDQEIIINLIYP
ncbi:MAG: DUF2141 domain-containing protein [Bacteroidales bacterium]